MQKRDNCAVAGKSLGEIVARRVQSAAREIKHLQEQIPHQTFLTLGELIQDFLTGKITFIPTGKVKITGDPANTLEMLKKGRIGPDDLALKGKPLEEVLLKCRDLVADLTYLLLKGAVVPETVGYVPPEYRSIASAIDVEELAKRFPEARETIFDFLGVGKVAVPAVIAAVDVVVLVVDAVQLKVDIAGIYEDIVRRPV